MVLQRKLTKAIELKYNMRSVKSQIPVNHCLWLIITIFLQIIILFFLLRSSQPSNTQHAVALNPSDCQSGYVYVYDLPPAFNKELIDQCHESDRGCGAVSNGGFGTKATGLEHVVPRNLTPAWYWTDMYSAEVIFHNRMLSHKCRTLDPEKAKGFYIPFYAGLDIGKFLFNYSAKDRDRKSEMLLDWLKEQPTFTRNKGVDHFIMLSRLTWDFRRLTDNDADWGSKLLHMPLMRHVFRLSVEKHQNDNLEESVPYPTAFHPRSESDIIQWQNYIRSYKRTKLFSFVGAKREKIKNDFRGVLMDYCKSEEDYCGAVDCATGICSDGATAIMETFLGSDFCLQPRGDGLTRRSMFDCMLAGSIPVYFWKGTFKGQYEWHLPWMPESYTVFIDNRDVRATNGSLILKVLESFHKDKVKEMRETLINLLPKFVYARSGEDLGSVKDAFDISIDRVLKRLEIGRNQLLTQNQAYFES
ncbi:xyloglucan galactosyltransferase XLT2-like [Nicotiana tabacum]|uniref:Xyloglucan galactosyltransferase XLT2-like n=1 Tax=Nicotiana tabacum TaxID=4097 RepID=A0AC58TR61_TOBAC